MFTATTHVAPKITVNPCGRLEIAYADGMELETRTEVCNPSLSLSPSSPSLLDLGLKLDLNIFYTPRPGSIHRVRHHAFRPARVAL